MASVCRKVAEHCIQLSNFRYAIEFLVRARRSDDAFAIAELHERMDDLAELIGDQGTPEQYELIGNYFCARNEMVRAGTFFTLAGDSDRSMKCYMSDGSDPAMDLAIDLAEKVPSRELREHLLEYLPVNMQAQTRDIRFLLSMFVIMRLFDEASETANWVAENFRFRGDPRASGEETRSDCVEPDATESHVGAFIFIGESRSCSVASSALEIRVEVSHACNKLAGDGSR
jgi:WD repeat-containing protein 19